MSLQNELYSCLSNSCPDCFVRGNTVLARRRIGKLEPVPCGMAAFHKIGLSDQAWIAPLLREEDSLASTGCFGTMYLWGTAFEQYVARLDDRILARYISDKGIAFAYPQGSGSLHRAVMQMKRQADSCGVPLVIQGMTECQMQQLQKEFPTQFVMTENRDSADYVYDIEKLVSLKGKKLQNKRNHCNRFEKEHPDWHFEPMERRHFADCLNLLWQWEDVHQDGDDMQDAERMVVKQAFANFESLALEGGVLFAEGKMAAFTVGELVGKNGFDTHLEKADATINGAYQMINREFARMLQSRHPDLKYINREEDMGLENLRKAKMSYHPDILLMKYSERWIG